MMNIFCFRSEYFHFHLRIWWRQKSHQISLYATWLRTFIIYRWNVNEKIQIDLVYALYVTNLDKLADVTKF